MAETPASNFLMYCSASSTAFTVVHCFQFKKKVLELNATLDQSSDRTVKHLFLWLQHEHGPQFCEEFAPRPGGTNNNETHTCEPIFLIIAEQNIIIKKTTTIEGIKEPRQFSELYIYTRIVFFCDNFILHCHIILFKGTGTSLSFVPPGRGANSSQNCCPCSFCSHKQRCSTVLSELCYEVVYNPNTFFLNLK